MSPAGLPGLDVARAIKREVERTQLRARKGIELIARQPPPMISMTPKDEVWALGKATLWRYRRPGRVKGRRSCCSSVSSATRPSSIFIPASPGPRSC